MRYNVDATVLVALGRENALDLLAVLDDPVVLPAVRDEVTREPEATNVARFLDRAGALADSPSEESIDRARDVLGEEGAGMTGDLGVVAAVLAAPDDEPVGVVSDDRRVRTVARGLGAEVTGTIGVVVYAVDVGRLDGSEAKRLVRDIDSHGLHMTGELRETADELIDEAADDGE